MYRISIHVQDLVSDANRTKVVIGGNPTSLSAVLTAWLKRACSDIDVEDIEPTAEIIS